MLILERRLDESVVIELPGGRLVTVQVVRIDRGRVRLGLAAARDVLILRSELVDGNPPATGG